MTISIDQPHNPMVNSGAIMSASILLHMVKKEMNMAQKYDYVLDFFRVKIIFFMDKVFTIFQNKNVFFPTT